MRECPLPKILSDQRTSDFDWHLKFKACKYSLSKEHYSPIESSPPSRADGATSGQELPGFDETGNLNAVPNVCSVEPFAS